MKIQQSDIRRFLQLVCKMWKSRYEGDSQIVVFTFTERSCSIATARDGLLLTYLCNRVDAETNEHDIAAPFELLQDCSNDTGVVDVQVIGENGERCIVAEWSDGLVQCSQRYPVQELPKYHLLPDLAWHTVDERMVWMLRSSVTETDREELDSNPRLISSPRQLQR